MTENQIGRGSTLLVLGTHQNQNKRHLCIILNDLPSDESQHLLYVPIISVTKKCDKTCILNVGDHEFIDHESCLHYARAEVRHIEQLLKRGKPRAPLAEDVLKRVCDGIFDSPLSRPFVKKFYEEHN